MNYNYTGIQTFQNFDARIFIEMGNEDLSDAINDLAYNYIQAVEKDFAAANLTDAVLHTGGVGSVWWETEDHEQVQWPLDCPNFHAWQEDAIARGLTVLD